MYPILTEALAAERIREWHDQAARHQLVKQARRARHQARPAAAELPGPRSGPPWPPQRTPASAATASGQPVGDDGCQPAGVRAA
jgi:hypothetical protein